MRFTDGPWGDGEDHPDEMRIGGRGRRARAAAGWAAAAVVLGGVLVGLFVWFGTSVACSAGLVVMMMAYMAAMAGWTGGNGR